MFILHLYRFFYVEGPCNNLLYLSNNHFLMLLFTYIDGHILKLDFGMYCPRIWCQLSVNLNLDLVLSSCGELKNYLNSLSSYFLICNREKT